MSVSVVSQTGDDKLVMVWDSGDDPQTIEPNNDTTTVFVLHFGLKGFQHVDDERNITMLWKVSADTAYAGKIKRTWMSLRFGTGLQEPSTVKF